MKFIALMLAITLGYLLQLNYKDIIKEIARYFKNYQDWYGQKFSSAELSSGWGGLAMFALVPAVILGLLIHIMSSQWIVLMLLLHILIILVCVVPIDPELVDVEGEQRDILPAFNIMEIVSMIFWYFIIGPIGILSVKLLYLSLDNKNLSKEASLMKFYVNWVPVRLLVLSYALVGNFHGVFNEIGSDYLKNDKNSEELAQRAAKSALWPHYEEMEKTQATVETSALFRRSIICWLAIIALISITF